MNNDKYNDGNDGTHSLADETPFPTKVGIYWSVEGVIIGEVVDLTDAEEYGDAFQHGGHYEFWEKLKPATESERKFKAHAYDYYPRGRMVFFPKRHAARLYVDSCLDSAARSAALSFFSYDESALEIEADDHYRCAGCNRHYLE
jgi:hypothetical protein